jgi:UTP-glucose-1-phosphate uridylyltransferase
MKCIIPVAGAAERLKPISKTVPKFMLPIGNVPLIDYALRECSHANVSHIVFVVGKDLAEKEFLFKYLDLMDSLDGYYFINPELTCSFSVQPERKGLGDAIYYGCRDLPPNEKFLVLLPDDIWIHDFSLNTSHYDNPLNLIREAKDIGVFTRYVKNTEEAKQYGVVQQTFPLFIEEKPKNPKSLQVVFGRYLLQKQYVELAYTLDQNKAEIGITCVLDHFKDKVKVTTSASETLFDCGNLKSYTKTWLAYAKLNQITLE